MLLQVVLTTLLALGAAPCVVQRACPARAPRPPSSVCMHRLHPDDNVVALWSHAHAHKGRAPTLRARVLLPALLRVPLVAVLLLVPLRVQEGGMRLPWVVLILFGACQAAPDCKTCVTLGKEEKAMFRMHSDACLAQSGADPGAVAGLLRGRPADSAPLRRHVYCVLLRCKLVGKDGKLLKTAALRKVAGHLGKNATKVVESCSEQHGDTPEDLAWNLFRCGLERKAALLEHVPAGARADHLP